MRDACPQAAEGGLHDTDAWRHWPPGYSDDWWSQKCVEHGRGRPRPTGRRRVATGPHGGGRGDGRDGRRRVLETVASAERGLATAGFVAMCRWRRDVVRVGGGVGHGAMGTRAEGRSALVMSGRGSRGHHSGCGQRAVRELHLRGRDDVPGPVEDQAQAEQQSKHDARHADSVARLSPMIVERSRTYLHRPCEQARCA